MLRDLLLFVFKFKLFKIYIFTVLQVLVFDVQKYIDFSEQLLTLLYRVNNRNLGFGSGNGHFFLIEHLFYRPLGSFWDLNLRGYKILLHPCINFRCCGLILGYDRLCDPWLCLWDIIKLFGFVVIFLRQALLDSLNHVPLIGAHLQLALLVKHLQLLHHAWRCPVNGVRGDFLILGNRSVQLVLFHFFLHK